MVGTPESVAPAAADGTASHLPPRARAVLRWLPTSGPSGAFAGQHDQVHCPDNDLHARVSLWWSDRVVHPGDHVGPPRGGMVPGAHASYNVALPAGGYLLVEDGGLVGWRAQRSRRLPLLRADGQHFEPGRYSVVQPYLKRHYTRMTRSAVRAALSFTGQPDVADDEISQVLRTIAAAADPVVCECNGDTRTSEPSPCGLVIPESLLVDSATLRVLVGEADPAETAATLWRLSGMIWDPVRVGRAMAAESVARNAGEHARGWPQAPITEQAVAHIAAQAIRFHGAPVVRAMPAWLLGWVMVAKPVLAAAEPHPLTASAGLDVADRVRVARVETQWHAMAATRLFLSRSSSALNQLDDPGAALWTGVGAEVDLRQHAVRPDASDDDICGMPLREAVRVAYHCDVRSWFGVIAEHS